jgi:hypothetical protein
MTSGATPIGGTLSRDLSKERERVSIKSSATPLVGRLITTNNTQMPAGQQNIVLNNMIKHKLVK